MSSSPSHSQPPTPSASCIPEVDPNSPLRSAPPIDGDPLYLRDGSLYANVTVDDSSPLVSFVNANTDWISHLEEPRLEGDPYYASKPDSDRIWLFGSYRRTRMKDAAFTINFYGTSLQLFGDYGPDYGDFTVSIDGGEASTHSAFSKDRFKGVDPKSNKANQGRPPVIYESATLEQDWHTATITNAGNGLLVDYLAIAVPQIPKEKVDAKGSDLIVGPLYVHAGNLHCGAEKNGTWAFHSLPDSVEGTLRDVLSTSDPFATLTHSFKGTGIILYGGRNETHGAYSVTVTNTNTSAVVSSNVYDSESIACGGRDSERCDYLGPAVKFAIGSLDPEATHQIRIQNLPRGDRNALEIDFMGILDFQKKDPNMHSGHPDEDEGGAAVPRLAMDSFSSFVVLLMSFMMIWRSFK